MPNYAYGFDLAGRFPNLGLVSIAGNIDEDLIDDIAIVDLVIVRTDIKRYIINLLNKFQPDIVGLSAISFQYQTALEIAKIIKSESKNIFTVFGGYHVTLAYDLISESQDINYIDYMIRGEGEGAFNKLIRAIIDGNSFAKIENLSYKQNGVFIHNSRSSNLDLDNIRLPKRNIRLTSKYYFIGKKADVIETSRGCTMACNFCCMPFMYGRTFRKYSIDRIIKDIKIAKKNGAKALFIVDDNVFLDLKHINNVCDAIIKNNLNDIHYTIQASVRGIASDRKLVEKMAKAGFKLIFLGIENILSANLDFLSKDKKNLTDSELAIKYIQDNGMITAGGFILGNPDDTEESFWSHFNFAKKMKLDMPVFFTIAPHIKTELRKKLLQENLVTNINDYCFYDGLQVNVRTKTLSSEDISYLLMQMNSNYTDWNYLKFNRIRKLYPKFFLKIIVKHLPKLLHNKLRNLFLRNAKFKNYKASRLRHCNRLKCWLLDREDKIMSHFDELKIVEHD